jgi:hypothetical protein
LCQPSSLLLFNKSLKRGFTNKTAEFYDTCSLLSFKETKLKKKPDPLLGDSIVFRRFVKMSRETESNNKHFHNASVFSIN